jgi:hypothetical protein
MCCNPPANRQADEPAEKRIAAPAECFHTSDFVVALIALGDCAAYSPSTGLSSFSNGPDFAMARFS